MKNHNAISTKKRRFQLRKYFFFRFTSALSHIFVSFFTLSDILIVYLYYNIYIVEIRLRRFYLYFDKRKYIDVLWENLSVIMVLLYQLYIV